MKLLTLKLANWLSRGAFVKSCKAATEWEARYREMSEKAVKLERSLNSTEQHLRMAEGALYPDGEPSLADRIRAVAQENVECRQGEMPL